MIKIEPQGQIYLCKTPLEADYKNQLTFASKEAQTSYFANTVIRSYDNSTYIRKDGGIKIACNAEEIRTCNYMFYRNTGFDNRIYYCFITSIEYLSENSTLVRFETDCFQTWYFDLVYKPCFVEREHVNNDTIGAHTVPEGLELGELVQNSSNNLEPNKTVWTSGKTEQLTNKYMIVFQVTELPVGSYGISMPHQYNGVYSGLFYVGVKSSSDATALIGKYAAESKSSSIIAIFIAPTSFFDDCEFSNIITSSGNVACYYPVDDALVSAMSDNDYTISMPSSLNGYTPKNNKLYTYPFSYILVDNNAGICITERFEDFTNPSSPSYYMAGALGQGCSIKLTPVGYKGSVAENYNEGITGMKLPICGWSSDYYTNWLTQNALNIPLTGAYAIGSAALGIASGMAGLAISGTMVGVAKIASLLGEQYKAQLVPDQAHGNTNCSDINIGWNHFYTVKCMSIKYEYAQIIDSFFTMFGYKVNIVKTPSITGRTYWNYVKTVDCNVEGDIPQEDLQIVRNMFNKGCTFWHDATNMYNYNLTNSIVS